MHPLKSEEKWVRTQYCNMKLYVVARLPSRGVSTRGRTEAPQKQVDGLD